jgi:GNAT superfamily N-acetyltransferase
MPERTTYDLGAGESRCQDKWLFRRYNSNIYALFVDEEYKGRGIDQVLLERATEVLIKAGCPRTWLTTAPATRAEQFYRVAGWRVTGTQDGNLVFEMLGEHHRS